MRILVTGGRGFIGRYVTNELTAQGYAYNILDKPDDIRSMHDVGTLARNCDAVIHLAGVLGTEELFWRSHQAVDVNIHGTLNVLEACEKYGLSYVGITMPSVWNNVYQATKQCSLNLASAWHQYRGVLVSHVRAFNAYGAGQKV